MNYFEEAKNINLQHFDTADSKYRYLVSYKGKHFLVDKKLFDILSILQVAHSTQEASEILLNKKGMHLSPVNIEYLLKEKIFSILNETCINTNNGSSFLYKTQLFTPQLVYSLSSYFKFLYKYWIGILVTTLNLVFGSLFILYGVNQSFYTLSDLDLYTFILVILVLFISTLVHELGHATACNYYNVRPGGIGLGIYINMITFYTDVTNIWQLKRKERIVVNLGGIYFQAIFLLPLYLIFFYSQNKLIGYIILGMNLNFLFVLNPFFRFDGYWIISDILRVPNLRKHGFELIKYLVLSRFKKTSFCKKPKLLSVSPAIKYAVLAYSSVSLIFMVFFFCFFIPKFVYEYFQEFPRIYQHIVNSISLGHIPFNFIYYILPRTILVALFVLFILKILYKFINLVNLNLAYILKNRK